MPDMPTGQLIRRYRIDRKKSTVNIATHAGITARYLEMIEAGTKTPSLPVLRKLAKVLGVRTSALVGEAPSEDHNGPVNPRLAEVERSLFTYRSVSLSDRENEPDLADIAERIRVASDAWYTSQTAYTDVLSVLPDLIVDVERLVQVSGRSPESCGQAYGLYRLARGVLKHAGRVDLCTLLADRAMRYAEESENPLTIAAASWTLAQAMLSDDMPQGSLDIAMTSAGKLEQLLPDGTPEHFSIYGGLIQCAAVAATRNGDPWRGRELLRNKARPAAERVGEGKDYHYIFFGPTNVSIHAVTLETEISDVSEALRLSNDVDISRVASLERQTSHLYHVAKCYECKGNDTAVLVHLKIAERLRPQDFQYKQLLRNMVATLVKRAKPSYASEVREFAGRIGLLN